MEQGNESKNDYGDDGERFHVLNIAKILLNDMLKISSYSTVMISILCLAFNSYKSSRLS